MAKPLVFNIQKYSIHDGDGIRTTIFFKGCPLKCLWCHNPESQSYEKELLVYRNRCTACGRCIEACPAHANEMVEGSLRFLRERCTACGKCVEACLAGAREIAGRTYEIEELVEETLKDRMFYETSGGGVTLSGGEAADQDMDYVEALCGRLHEEGIGIDIDTSGHTDFSRLKRLMPYTDTFLYDIKDMDPEEHRKAVGADNGLILGNLTELSRLGARINIRLPLIEGINADGGHIEKVIDFLKENDIHPVGINLLPYHNTGRAKYLNLGREYPNEKMSAPPAALLDELADMFRSEGFENVRIGG